MERIYGIHNGGYDKVISSTNGGSDNVTQDDLLKQLGIDKESYRRAKSLTTLPPEIQALIEQGNISPSTASRLIAKLTQEQQEELIKSLPVTEKLTQKQVQEYVNQLQSKQTSVDLLKRKYVELQEQLKDFSKSERMEYALRLAKIESIKARERQSATQFGDNSNGGGNISTTEGKVRDIVANKIGIGSGKQFDKEKFIYENQSSLTQERQENALTTTNNTLLRGRIIL